MKFHKQLKVPGLDKSQIIEGLNKLGLEMRPMREEYFGQKKFKPTNTYSNFVIVVEDELVELRADGDYNVWSTIQWIGRDGFDLEHLTMQYTKSDIGYEKDGWVTYNKDGHKVGTKYIKVHKDGRHETVVAK